MNILCHVVSGTVAACAALGAATFLALWGQNGFRGLPERAPPMRRMPSSSFPIFDIDAPMPNGTREPKA